MKKFNHLSLWKQAKALWTTEYEARSKELAESGYETHGQHPEPVSLGFLLLAISIQEQAERIDALEIRIKTLEELV